MTVLPDHEIEAEMARSALMNGQPLISPYDPEQVQPSSYDVRLSGVFRVFRNHERDIIDPREDMSDLTELVVHDEFTPFVLHPGEFVLGSTMERLCIPNAMVARIEGKSSLGRLGLVIHSTAGYIDPGFDGTITLEMTNFTRLPIRLWPNMKIGQVSFSWMASEARKPYGSPGLGSKYQGQTVPVASRMHQNGQ